MDNQRNNKMTFECHYCGAVFPDFTGLVKHFETEHRNKNETPAKRPRGEYGHDVRQKFLRERCNPQNCPIWDKCQGTAPALCQFYQEFRDGMPIIELEEGE
jgi:hypothetical protein